MTNTDNFPCKLNDRIYIVQRKYNKICYGNIVGINLEKRISSLIFWQSRIILIPLN